MPPASVTTVSRGGLARNLFRATGATATVALTGAYISELAMRNNIPATYEPDAFRNVVSALYHNTDSLRKKVAANRDEDTRTETIIIVLNSVLVVMILFVGYLTNKKRKVTSIVPV